MDFEVLNVNLFKENSPDYIFIYMNKPNNIEKA